MERVYVKSGVVQGDLSFKIYGMYDFSRRCSRVRFRQIIPPSREIHSIRSIDNCIREVNETFSEAGHETHDMR